MLRKIVYTPGVWDVLHIGHLNLIKRAKLLGDILVVGVCADSICNKKIVNNEYIRLEMINNIKCVDYCLVYTDLDQSVQLDFINANIFVIGEEFGFQGVWQHEISLNHCKLKNIEIVRMNRTPGISSSLIRNFGNE